MALTMTNYKRDNGREFLLGPETTWRDQLPGVAEIALLKRWLPKKSGLSGASSQSSNSSVSVVVGS
jgi:hypothetical protein